MIDRIRRSIAVVALCCAACSTPASSSEQPERPPGTVVHTEFQSEDAQGTRDFLAKMFDMTPRESSTPAGPLYSFEGADQTGFAVRDAASHEGGPGTTAYFHATDLDATLARAERLGAKVIVPKMPFEGKGYIAWIEVPGGVRMAFLQPDASVE
jgi:hypothetical protein